MGLSLLDVWHVIPNMIEEIRHPCLRLSNLHSFSSSDSFSLELCDPFMELAKQVLIPLFGNSQCSNDMEGIKDELVLLDSCS